MDRTMRAGVHSQRKATGPQLPKPGEKAKLEGSRSVQMIFEEKKIFKIICGQITDLHYCN